MQSGVRATIGGFPRWRTLCIHMLKYLVALPLLSIPLCAQSQWQPAGTSLEQACADTQAFAERQLDSWRGAFHGADIRLRAMSYMVRAGETQDAESLELLQEYVQQMLRFVGEILPRIERAMDLPAIEHHLRNDSLVPSEAATTRELASIALTEILRDNNQHALIRLARFLEALGRFENKAAALRAGAQDTTVDDLIGTAALLRQRYDHDWVAIVRNALFDAGLANDLQQRMFRHCPDRHGIGAVLSGIEKGAENQSVDRLPPDGSGVLANRPLGALCDSDPDIFRYYQRERRGVFLGFDVRTGALLMMLQDFNISEPLADGGSAKAKRLLLHADEVRRQLTLFFPSMASVNDTTLKNALSDAYGPGTGEEAVYVLLDRFLVRGILKAAPRDDDKLGKFIDQLAAVRALLQQLAHEPDKVERQLFDEATTKLADIYRIELRPALRHMLVKSAGLTALEAYASEWCVAWRSKRY